MSEHYYSKQPSVKHDRKELEVVLRDRAWRFMTDAGVFSKNDIDYGSRLLVETVELPSDAKVLDMGCGYGPIGLSAAVMASHGHVVLADVNERALELARENAKRNGLANVEVVKSDLFTGLEGQLFSHILTNPPIRAGKQVVHQLFDDAYKHLTMGGELWIVIQKKQGAPSAMSKLEQIFAAVQVMEQSKGYRIIKAVKS